MTQACSPDDHTYSDDEWDEWKDYADRVGIVIKFKLWAGADDNDQAWYVESDGAAWSKDWLTRQLVDLAAADGHNSCCGRGNYFLDTRDSKTEWGASGAVFEAVLTLSENLLTEATSAAVGALAARLAARMKESHPGWFGGGQPLTQEQARASAQNTVERTQGLSYGTLELRSLEFLDDRVVLVELRDRSSGRCYTVEVTGHSESVRASRIRKVVQPDDDASQPGSAPGPSETESGPPTG